MTNPEPTVFIVDDDPDMARSLAWLMRSAGLRAEVSQSAEQFLANYDPTRPGCMVLDVRMPGMSGLELHDKLRTRGFCLPIIIITGHADIPMATRALKNGAFDFIEKPFSRQALLDRVNQALRLDAEQRCRHEEQDRIAAAINRLTRRERDVFTAVVAGKLNKQIARELGISIKTVEVHRANMMVKMQADSLADLVRMAMIVGQR